MGKAKRRKTAEAMQLNQALLVFYVSRDDGEHWSPILPADVPEWLKEPARVAKMMSGHIAKRQSPILTARIDTEPWYRCEAVHPHKLLTQ